MRRETERNCVYFYLSITRNFEKSLKTCSLVQEKRESCCVKICNGWAGKRIAGTDCDHKEKMQRGQSPRPGSQRARLRVLSRKSGLSIQWLSTTQSLLFPVNFRSFFQDSRIKLLRKSPSLCIQFRLRSTTLNHVFSSHHNLNHPLSFNCFPIP